MDIATIIQQAASPDISPEARLVAQRQLEDFESTNLAGYVTHLCQLLNDASKNAELRQRAGLALKNALDARDANIAVMKEQRWLAQDAGLRENIKNMLLSLLPNQVTGIRNTAAQIIGKIAMVEVPVKQWPNLIPSLCHNINGRGDPAMREASFAALGYVCEEVPDAAQEHSTAILIAIQQGMSKEETNMDIKKAATTALANSLEFVKSNFERENERDMIMTMILEVTKVPKEDVRVAAYQCIVEICSAYYDYLSKYISHIFQLSAQAIKHEEEDVAKQAIEIWNTICDEEIDIIESIQEAELIGEQPKRILHKFVEQALPHLTPLILECLTKQDEDDGDNWNLATAGGACLGLLSQTCTDAITPLVLPFVQTNIGNPNWRLREAAIISFGCILSGPDPQKLGEWVSQALPLLIYHLKDQSPQVKDTTAWTIGRICEFVPETTEQCLPQLMTALLESLTDTPKVSSNVCWAIHNLAFATSVDLDDPSSPLSPYFNALIHALLTVTYRSDTDQANLLVSAYEAINSLISTAAKDMYPTIATHVLPALLEQHKQLAAREGQNQVQALLCACLQVIIQKLSDNAIIPFGNDLMLVFINVLQSKDAVTHEEAFLAVGALASRLGEKFDNFMKYFFEILLTGLKNSGAYSTCISAVGVVSELTRALEKKIFPYCDLIMQALLDNLRDPNVERSVKPHIISVISDIALAVEGNFDRYLPYVMTMLVQASQLDLDCEDSENLEYLTTLREAVLEAYTGILHGLKADNKQGLFKQWISEVVSFLVVISQDNYRAPAVTKCACGVVGDIATAIPEVMQLLMQPAVHTKLIQTALTSEETKESAQYAYETLQKFSSI